MEKRGTVNGESAVIDFKKKTYIPVNEHCEILETLDGKLIVNSRRADYSPNELPLLPSDKVGIERPLDPWRS